MAEAKRTNTNGMAVGQLRAFVERIERLDEEAASLNNDRKEVYAEAKMMGFDTKAIKAVVKKRRMESADREEQDQIFQLYWDAIHGDVPNADLEEKVSPPAPARARAPEATVKSSAQKFVDAVAGQPGESVSITGPDGSGVKIENIDGQKKITTITADDDGAGFLDGP